jgi:ABC-type multidrug transport system ATPase subunit
MRSSSDRPRRIARELRPPAPCPHSHRADGLVAPMECSLDTVVGERGSLLSSGERQRIALARAMLRRARLLVLDEATSAIDVEAEHDILCRLLGLRPRPSIVLVAHRRESLGLCLFENGKATCREVTDGALAHRNLAKRTLLGATTCLGLPLQRRSTARRQTTERKPLS